MKITESAALLASIIAQPEDNTPRLVYADWLDEHGQHARAELIRVQCEMATLPSWLPRRKALAWRERAILDRHGAEWKLAMPKFPGIRWGKWDRGFISEIIVEGTAPWAKYAKQLIDFIPLHSLYFGSGTMAGGSAPLPTYANLKNLKVAGHDMLRNLESWINAPLMQSIRRLDMSDLNLDNSGMESLGTARNLRILQELILDRNSFDMEGMLFLRDSNFLRNIRSLSLQGVSATGYGADSNLGTDAIKIIADSSFASNLRKLDLSQWQMDENSLSVLLDSDPFMDLEELHLSECSLDSIDPFTESESEMRLKVLNLNANPFGSGISALAESSVLSELEVLCINNCEITDYIFASLVNASWWETIHHLDVSINSLGTTKITPFAQINAPELTHLDLSNNDLTDSGIIPLTDPNRFPNLVDLNLSDNHLTPVGLNTLIRAEGLETLQSLHITKNFHKSTDHELAEVLQKLGESKWCRNLRSLRMSDCRLDGGDWKALLFCPLESLQELSVCGNLLSTKSFSHDIFENHWPSLIRLDISGNNFTSGRLAPLFATPFINNLVCLGLRSCQLNDFSIEDIFNSPRFENLVYIDLYGNRIGERGIKNMVDPKKISTLKTVVITEKLSKNAEADYQKKYPHPDTIDLLLPYPFQYQQ